MTLPPLYIARHAETVFNAGARMQGNHAHTPLTRRGFSQAEAMGEALAKHFGKAPEVDIWASAAGRCQQTAGIIAEHLGHNFFDVTTDERLFEIDVGLWAGRDYAEIMEEAGRPIVDAERGLFCVRPPEGEWYPDIRRRVDAWLAELPAGGPVIVVTHGMTARILRGALVGGTPFEPDCVPIADGAPQGSIHLVEDGRETLLFEGSGAQKMQKGY
ncbi:phosphoglycerate mutase [Pacificimonas flava]|uniref:Phosphoglycerate mutase n=2 Tax=Pacificimonas TaxID=1960290 RepID=A0A219B3R7_9SPHN|nr:MULTISPECIES: histidine phosphatase family protein [Pacificimonas]MBZ6377303.1 histidine phosphatase family protein [Pacificimonas aurantium]OWV32987.1 phosphoglycerate mutase [Pacificimonas flava]